MKFENWNEAVELKKRYDDKINEIKALNDLLERIDEGKVKSVYVVAYVNDISRARIDDVDVTKDVIDVRLRTIESEVDGIMDRLKEL